MQTAKRIQIAQKQTLHNRLNQLYEEQNEVEEILTDDIYEYLLSFAEANYPNDVLLHILKQSILQFDPLSIKFALSHYDIVFALVQDRRVALEITHYFCSLEC